MSGWTTHDGRAVALDLDNVDTDQLIPARFMSTPRAQGYGTFLLHDMRFDAEGAPRTAFPINAHPEATVLVAGRNFGSGSSREAAVYALVDFGIRAVIAPSFGDIFAANAVNNGLLPARAEAGDVAGLIAALDGGAAAAHIDLETGTAQVAGQRIAFALDDVWRQKLINGWDDIDLTRAHAAEIAAFRAGRRRDRAWAYPTT
jgi:3-isopropylmalate/(R)-2-methylmalate dehydratase small subunit